VQCLSASLMNYYILVLFAVVEIREVKYGDRTGIYWLGSYPFPLAKRDVSFDYCWTVITFNKKLCCSCETVQCFFII